MAVIVSEIIRPQKRSQRGNAMFGESYVLSAMRAFEM
jgi:hypothetical protein